MCSFIGPVGVEDQTEAEEKEEEGGELPFDAARRTRKLTSTSVSNSEQELET